MAEYVEKTYTCVVYGKTIMPVASPDDGRERKALRQDLRRELIRLSRLENDEFDAEFPLVDTQTVERPAFGE